MKKIALLFVAMLAAFAMQAQFETTTLSEKETWATYTTDVSITGATATYWYIVAPKDYYTAQWVMVNMDTVNSNHDSITVQFQGRYSANDAWANIGSAVNWKLTADTTFEILNSTENGYRHFKLLFTPVGASGSATIDWVEFKQWIGIP